MSEDRRLKRALKLAINIIDREIDFQVVYMKLGNNQDDWLIRGRRIIAKILEEKS